MTSARSLPGRAVSGLLAGVFGLLVLAAVWDRIWWMLGLAVVLAVLAFMYRRELSHRVEPLAVEQASPHSDRPKFGRWLWQSGWIVWIPMTIVLPPRPEWIGPFVGVIAALHVFALLASGTAAGSTAGSAAGKARPAPGR